MKLSGFSSSIARSTWSIQPGWPGVKMAWLMTRPVPAASLIFLRALNFISLVRNQSVGSSDGAPEISATLVSLSRKTSLNQLAYFRLSRLCSAGFNAGFQPARPTAFRISTKPMWRVSSRR